MQTIDEKVALIIGQLMIQCARLELELAAAKTSQADLARLMTSPPPAPPPPEAAP